MLKRLLLLLYLTFLFFNLFLYLMACAKVFENEILCFLNIIILLSCFLKNKDINTYFQGLEPPSWLLYVLFIFLGIFTLGLSE